MPEKAPPAGTSATELHVLSSGDDPDVPTFQAFTALVNSLNNGITVDAEEWAQYTTWCNQAASQAADQEIHTYTQLCQGLWTNGEDQDSWNSVKQAAINAAPQDDHAALMTILNGFLPITNPSHNSDEWGALRSQSYSSLNVIDPDPFRVLMRTVRQLNDGITTDAGEWAQLTEICEDAVNSGIRTYIQRCQNELWTTGLDHDSWASVIHAAASAATQADDGNALTVIMLGYLVITQPSHNSDEWAALRALAIARLVDGASVPFSGSDTRARRTLVDPDSRLPKEMSVAYMMKRADFPARYTEVLLTWKRCHVEYFMRLDTTDPEGAAYFIITHSQDYGGYVGLAKVEGQDVGTGSADHVVPVGDPPFAGEVVWWDHLDVSHPGGCNHPGNGGQLSLETGAQFGPVAVIVGQDWTKFIPVYGHVVEPVGKGSKVLFYNFSMLNAGRLPTMAAPGSTTDAYMGYLTTEQLGLLPGDDGEVSSVNIEQGPDGMYYLIAGNRNQTVLWRASDLDPDITKWQQVPLSSSSQLNDGSSMLAWATFGDAREPFLYYVQSGDDGMNLRQVMYMVIDNQIVGVHVSDAVAHQTSQCDMFGDDDWIADNGSLYAGGGGGVALHGTYKSINDSKGPPGQETPCIQVRAWYSS